MHLALRSEFEAVEATECGNELILLADRLTKPIDFNVAGLFGKVGRSGGVTPSGVHGSQKPDREGAR